MDSLVFIFNKLFTRRKMSALLPCDAVDRDYPAPVKGGFDLSNVPRNTHLAVSGSNPDVFFLALTLFVGSRHSPTFPSPGKLERLSAV
jgi:hypothetical protein